MRQRERERQEDIRYEVKERENERARESVFFYNTPYIHLFLPKLWSCLSRNAMNIYSVTIKKTIVMCVLH